MWITRGQTYNRLYIICRWICMECRILSLSLQDMHIISTDEKQVFAAVQEWNQNHGAVFTPSEFWLGDGCAATYPESGFRGVLWNDLGEQRKMPTGSAVPLLCCTEWKLKAWALTKPTTHWWTEDWIIDRWQHSENVTSPRKTDYVFHEKAGLWRFCTSIRVLLDWLISLKEGDGRWRPNTLSLLFSSDFPKHCWPSPSDPELVSKRQPLHCGPQTDGVWTNQRCPSRPPMSKQTLPLGSGLPAR